MPLELALTRLLLRLRDKPASEIENLYKSLQNRMQLILSSPVELCKY
jgi:hypothetical protein